jgi:predicted dehydrogenase
METSPLKVGIIGCGTISGIYLKNAAILDPIEIVAVADLYPAAAQAKAEQFQIPKVYSPAELLADPDIDIVLNLTTPDAHGTIALAALNAGKSVYNEKPLALTRLEGRQMLTLAQEKGLRIGCAPDTFLGGGIQTCRQLIDDGAIGVPVAATAFMMSRGHEFWHPNPEFYYKPGGGPMFDMGPYYLTALVFLLGPVRRVTGLTRITRPERTITSEPKAGTIIKVEVPTHVAGLLDFANGAIGTIITSFDVQKSTLPRIEIYGTQGTLIVPDPNTFGGPVTLAQSTDFEWREIPLTHGYDINMRGLGVADMATGIATDRPHRANGELAYHVLDIMHAFHDASATGRHIELTSTCQQPAPLPAQLA